MRSPRRVGCRLSMRRARPCLLPTPRTSEPSKSACSLGQRYREHTGVQRLLHGAPHQWVGRLIGRLDACLISRVRASQPRQVYRCRHSLNPRLTGESDSSVQVACHHARSRGSRHRSLGEFHISVTTSAKPSLHAWRACFRARFLRLVTPFRNSKRNLPPIWVYAMPWVSQAAQVRCTWASSRSTSGRATK